MAGFSQPALNACLNATSAVCLTVGWVMIRQQRRQAHAICMVTAVVVSLAFLVSYLDYHYHVGSKHFPGTGVARYVYFTILLTHTILAMVVALWLAPVTLICALRQRFDKHKRIARWTLPIWLYVSITGVIVYFMLYVWYAQP